MRYLILSMMLLVGITANAQNKMTVTMKDGSNISLYVSEIEKMTWTEENSGGGDNDPSEQTVTGDATDITSYSATVTCYANNILDNLSTDLKIGIIYCTEGTPSKSNGTQITVYKSSVGTDGKYTVNITNLSNNTTYYYRSFVYQSGIYFYGTTKSFTTTVQQAGVNFMTGEASSITCFSAKVAAQMTIDASSVYNKLSYGIAYGTTAEPTTKTTVTSRDASGNYTATLRALAGSTIYYYRPYATLDDSTYYGPVSSFKTLADNVVTTGDMDEDGNVKSKLTIGGGAYSTLKLGLCWSNKNAEPMVSDITATITEVDDENCYSLNVGEIYGTIYYRAYVLIDGVAHYGAVKSVDRIYDCSGDTKEYVDLGLSVKWATCNVGATSPEEYGDYFAWGETTPKTSYSWSTYTLCNGSSSTMTKYCTSSSYGTVDNKTVLESSDDAATANWGGSWRMPTYAEQTELRTGCYWEWTSSYNSTGVAGYIVYKVKSDSDKGVKKYSGSSTTTVGSYTTSDTHIFLPAAGYRYNSVLDTAGSYGYYWSSSLYSSNSYNAFDLYFNSYFVDCSGYRFLGRSVRPVCQ